MATIDEMINLARAQRRPSTIEQLGQVANTALGSYMQGVGMRQAQDMHRLEIAKTMLEMQQMQRQAQVDQALDAKLGLGYTDATANGVNTNPTPVGKLNVFAPKPPVAPTAAPSAPQMASAGVSDTPTPAGMPPTAGAAPVPPMAPPSAPPAPGIHGLNLPPDMELSRENGHWKPTFKGLEEMTPDQGALAVLGPNADPAKVKAVSAQLAAQYPDGRIPRENVNAMSAALNREAENTRFNQGQRNTIDTQETDAYLNESKETRQALMDANRNSGLISDAAKNPSASRVVPVSIADMFTKRMSPEILSRFGGSDAIMAKATQIGNEMANGKLTPENLGYLKQLNDTLTQSAQQNYQGIGVRHAKIRVSRLNNMGVPATLPDAYHFLTGDQMTNGSGTATPPLGGSAVTHVYNAQKGIAEPVAR